MGLKLQRVCVRAAGGAACRPRQERRGGRSALRCAGAAHACQPTAAAASPLRIRVIGDPHALRPGFQAAHRKASPTSRDGRGIRQVRIGGGRSAASAAGRRGRSKAQAVAERRRREEARRLPLLTPRACPPSRQAASAGAGRPGAPCPPPPPRRHGTVPARGGVGVPEPGSLSSAAAQPLGCRW